MYGPGTESPGDDGEADETTQLTESGEVARASPPLQGTLSLERLRAALPQVVAGLKALHAGGMIHSDIKPENLFATAEGRICILDFGLLTESMSRVESARGTPAFMPPEQFQGVITEAADWYAVGVLLYGALTGRLPATCCSPGRARAKVFSRPVDPRILAPDLPDDLADLAMRLLEGDPRHRPSGEEIARIVGLPVDSDSRTGPSLFVGRARELQRLERAFEEVRLGNPRIVHLHGDSGIGKTTLISSFARLVTDRGGSVFRGTCHIDASVPYKALDCVIDQIAMGLRRRYAPLSVDDWDALKVMFPVFGSPEQRSELDPANARLRGVRALRALFSRLASSEPVVICIDDIQWTDTESIDLLADVLSAPTQPEILLVLSYRWAQEGGGRQAEYVRRRLPGDQDIGLGPFDVPTLRTIVGAATMEVPPDVFDVIAQESRGNPFLVGELLRAHVMGDWGEALSAASVLGARVRTLDAAHRTYLEFVAVASRPISEAVLGRALGAAPGSLREARRVLLSESCVRIAEVDKHSIEAYHDRIAEYVLQRLSPEVLRARHEALAEAYEVFRAEPETLAVHFRGCGRTEKALLYTEMAGDAAVRALAFDHAAELYEGSIDLAVGEHRQALRVKHADALSKAGRPADAAKSFVAATENQKDDPELLARAGDELLRAGDLEQGLACLRRAAKLVGESFPERAIDARLALLYSGLRLRAARYRPNPNRSIPVRVRQRLSLCQTFARGLIFIDFVLASLFHLRFLAIALKYGSRADVVQGLAAQAGICAQLPPLVAGGIPRAKRLLARAEELVQESDGALTRATVLFAPAVIALAEGRWRSAREGFERVILLLQESAAFAFRWDVALCQTLLHETLWNEGDLTAMRARQRTVTREAKDNMSVEFINNLREGLLLALCDDRPADGRRLMTETMARTPREPWRIAHHFDYLGQSEIDLYEGKADSAHERIRTCRILVKRAGFDKISSHAAQYSILRTRTALALRLFSAAQREIDLLLRDPSGWARPIGRALLGCLALARGDRRAATVALESALPDLRSWDLGLYVAAAGCRLAQVRSDSIGERSALRDLSRRGVRVPENLVSSLLPTSLT